MIPDTLPACDPFGDADLHEFRLDDVIDYETTPEGSPFWEVEDAHEQALFDTVLDHTNPALVADLGELDVEELMFSTTYDGFDPLFSSESASSPSSSADDLSDSEDDSEESAKVTARPMKRKADDDIPSGKKGKKASAKPRAGRNAISAQELARVQRECTSDEAKRRVHNLSERNRRGNMKNQYHALRECIPELAGNDRPSNRTILSKAVDCIFDLQRQEREIEQQLAQLREENRRLLQRK